MSCRLDPEELKKVMDLLERFRNIYYEEQYEWALQERKVTEEEAAKIAEEEAAKIDHLFEKLKIGECPTSAEKELLKLVFASSLCTREHREQIKKIYPKLRMRWTKWDEENVCRA